MWKESVTCAFLCKIIGKTTGQDSEELFTVGMFHNIGKLMIRVHE